MKETFIIRTEWKDAILELSETDQAIIFRNLFLFHSGEDVVLPNQSVRLIWKLLEPNLIRNIDSYDKRRETSKENGNLGGRPNEDRVTRSISGKNIPNHSNSHWVYLILDSSNGDVKIGETRNLYTRRQTIKRSSYDLAYIDFHEVKNISTGRTIEADFIQEFISNRISGDWFQNIDIQKATDFLNNHSLIVKPIEDLKTYPITQKPIEDLKTLSVSVSVPDNANVIVKESIEQRKLKFATLLSPFVGTGPDKYSREFVKEFYDYWTEHGPNDKKFRREKQTSFDISRRLGTFKKNEIKFNKGSEGRLDRLANM